MRPFAIEQAQLAQRVDCQPFELMAQLAPLQLDDHGSQRRVLVIQLRAKQPQVVETHGHHAALKTVDEAFDALERRVAEQKTVNAFLQQYLLF